MAVDIRISDALSVLRARIGNPWPQAVCKGRRKLYDRAAIDRIADCLSGPVEQDQTEAITQARKRHAC